MITIALSKGRIFDDILPLLKSAGIVVLDDPEKSRKLILDTNQLSVRVLLVRATDVPTYVQYGGADIGVVGKDTLLESDTWACTSRWICKLPSAASAWLCVKALTIQPPCARVHE